MARKAIYLSGWEYNRLRFEDPATPANSGLPAEALWNGAAQFWLFEKVYCTKESLDGEKSGWDELGWTTGEIFLDLERRKILETVDWSRLTSESELLRAELNDTHAKLRATVSEQQLFELLKAGAAYQLEALKLELLDPILRHLECVSNISPNSINAWFRDATPTGETPAVAAAIQRSGLDARLHLNLCRPPGTGVSQFDLSLQRKVEESVQKPMIPDLLAGVLPQDDYTRALVPTRSVYQPINEQLRKDYAKGVDKLLHLRDVASKHLWPDLHGEWLPRLEDDPAFYPELTRLVRDAVMTSRFDPFLDDITRLAIIGVSTAVGSAVYLGATLLGADPLAGTPLATAAGAMTKQVLDNVHTRRRDTLRSLSLFYQALRRKGTKRGRGQ